MNDVPMQDRLDAIDELIIDLKANLELKTLLRIMAHELRYLRNSFSAPTKG